MIEWIVITSMPDGSMPRCGRCGCSTDYVMGHVDTMSIICHDCLSDAERDAIRAEIDKNEKL